MAFRMFAAMFTTAVIGMEPPATWGVIKMYLNARLARTYCGIFSSNHLDVAMDSGIRGESMSRTLIVGAAQLGPISRTESRKQVVTRLLNLLREAHSLRCDVVAFPELALTTFFPRWPLEDESEIDSFYETAMPGPETRLLFEEAAKLGIGFS